MEIEEMELDGNLNVAEIICFEFENWKFGLENWNQKDIEKGRRWETLGFLLFVFGVIIGLLQCKLQYIYI